MSDLISRQAAIDALQKEIDKSIPPFDDIIGAIRCGVRLARNIVEDLPTAQPEVTEETVREYCRKRCLTILPNDYYLELLSTQLEQTIGRLTSEVHDRLMDETGGKAVCKNEHWGRKPDDFSEHMNPPED